MVVELFTIFSILIGGSLLARSGGISNWASPAIGFILGTGLMIILGSVQVITQQPTSSVATLLLTIFIPMALWAWYHRKGLAVSFRILPAFLFLSGTFIGVSALRTLSLFNLTPDSYRYAQVGALFESGKIASAQPYLLLNRMLAVPLMHAPANLNDNFYLCSITPLLALATVLSLTWFCQKGLKTKKSNHWLSFALPPVAALLLLTNQFFVYNAFYVNGHVLYAALLMLICGSSWLYARNADVPKNALNIILYFSVPALVLTRPEAALHASLALMPVFVSNKFHLRQKSFLLATLSISIVIWNGFLLSKYLASDQSPPLAVIGMFCFGVVLFIAAPLLFSSAFDRISGHILSLTEIALWTTLLVATIIDPEMFSISVFATIENIIMGKGLWGYSLIVLGVLFIGVLILLKSSDQIFFRFPVTTFLPLGLLLAFLRGTPYRIGAIDSLNRMFLHILPITILFIVSSVMIADWGFRKNNFIQ